MHTDSELRVGLGLPRGRSCDISSAEVPHNQAAGCSLRRQKLLAAPAAMLGQQRQHHPAVKFPFV